MYNLKSDSTFAGPWWLTPILLATWEAEIGRIKFKASLGK
jgi:hypothetical protein